MTPDAPRQKATQTDTAYRALRREVIECRLAPGSTISEPILSERMDQGRAAIRAALIRLSHEGLLIPKPRRGYVVAPLTLKDARNILDLRIILEPNAAYLAAGNVDRESFAAVRRQFRLGYELDRADTLSAFLAANREGRRILGQASGNARLAEMILQLVDALERYLRLGLMTENRSHAFAESHDILVDLLVAGRAEEAAALSRSQMIASRGYVMDALMQSSGVQETSLVGIRPEPTPPASL